MKKQLNILIILALAVTMGFMSCKKDKDEDPTPTPTPETPFFNFGKVGNTATYTTSATVLTQSFTGTMTMTVLEKYSNNVYKVEQVLDLGIPLITAQTDTSFWLITNTDFADVDDASGANKFLYLTKSSVVGSTYTYTDTATYTRTVLSVNESVTVPAGTFSTYKIKETNSSTSGETIYYIHKDAGLIKTNILYPTQFGNLNVDVKMSTKSY